MKERLLQLAHQLGALGIGAAAMLGAVALFHFTVLGPLEAREASLKERLVREPREAHAAQPASAAYKVAAVYQHLRRDEAATDWLARLHAIGAASGLELKSAAYRSQATEGRIVRYELVLPLAGSYPQIREFLGRSLAEIPVMSVDQLTLRRERRDDAALQGELRLTLHMVRS